MINLKMFKSRTFWTIIGLFLVNGVSGIQSYIPENLLPLVNGVLSILAIYFRVSPAQSFKGVK